MSRKNINAQLLGRAEDEFFYNLDAWLFAGDFFMITQPILFKAKTVHIHVYDLHTQKEITSQTV